MSYIPSFRAAGVCLSADVETVFGIIALAGVADVEHIGFRANAAERIECRESDMERQISRRPGLSIAQRSGIILCVLAVLSAGVVVARHPFASARAASSSEPRPQRGGPSENSADALPVALGPAQSQRATPPKIIPWLEVNTSDDKLLADCIAGLKMWQQITDTAIISTTPGHQGIYPKIRAAVPGMKIIPGIKTANLLRPFDSLDGWRKLADEVRRACDLAGDKRCVLENETALYDENRNRNNYWSGEAPVNHDQLKAGFRSLPKDIEIWFYPSFVTASKANKTVYERNSELLCRSAQEVLDVRFVDSQLAKPPERNDWWNTDLTKMRAAIVKKPSIPIVYFWGDDKYWKESDLERALSLVPGDDMILYPGAKRWKSCAETISTAMKKR